MLCMSACVYHWMLCRKPIAAVVLATWSLCEMMPTQANSTAAASKAQIVVMQASQASAEATTTELRQQMGGHSMEVVRAQQQLQALSRQYSAAASQLHETGTSLACACVASDRALSLLWATASAVMPLPGDRDLFCTSRAEQANGEAMEQLKRLHDEYEAYIAHAQQTGAQRHRCRAAQRIVASNTTKSSNFGAELAEGVRQHCDSQV